MRKVYLELKFLLILVMVFQMNSQSENEQIDKQTEYIQQFAKTMADFIPTETFTFELGTGEQQNLILWPSQEIQKIRGVFYIDSPEDPQAVDGQGFFVGCQINGVVQKTFVNQRLGVFTFYLKTKPTNIKLIFKSDVKPLSIYMSYELKKQQQAQKPLLNTDQNVPTKEQQQLQQKRSKLAEVSEKFGKVQTTVQSQENSLRMILKHISKNGRRLEGNLKYAYHRIVIQTVIVILSGLFGMWILKKRMNSGYELLV